MSGEYDEDSQMLSSPDDSDTDLATPSNHAVPSPPDSTYRSPTRSDPLYSQGQPLDSSFSNPNGKRPLTDISNGQEDAEELAAVGNGKHRQDLPVKTHEASGYSWSRPEDEPGYAWLNKKAMDEHSRALESVVHQEFAIKSEFRTQMRCSGFSRLTRRRIDKYGDPFEIADRERKMAAALKDT